jgi:hypothetical protein
MFGPGVMRTHGTRVRTACEHFLALAWLRGVQKLFARPLTAGRPRAVLCSEGLDWVVAEAQEYSLKLILVLTDSNAGYGGMEQYVKWASGQTVFDFYNDTSIRVRTHVLSLPAVKLTALHGNQYRTNWSCPACIEQDVLVFIRQPYTREILIPVVSLGVGTRST